MPTSSPRKANLMSLMQKMTFGPKKIKINQDEVVPYSVLQVSKAYYKMAYFP